MHYSTTMTLAHQEVSDCLVLPVLKNKTLSTVGRRIDEAMQGQLSKLIQTDLRGEIGHTITLYHPQGIAAKRLLIVATGDQEFLSRTQFAKLMRDIIKALDHQNIQSVCCYLEEYAVTQSTFMWKVAMAVQQFEESIYTFNQFKTEPSPSTSLTAVTFYAHNIKESSTIEHAILKGTAVAAGMKVAKDLANTPANHATPTQIAAYAKSLSSKNMLLETEVYDKTHETIKAMGGLLGVAQGSDEPLQFVVVRYTPPHSSATAPIVLVGKGVTFDAGGISIKPATDMGEMKFDMAGAASVLGTLEAVSQLKLAVPVIGVLPLTENLINGSALKPGDVIKTLSGKTVEIVDTDAEGRLILADALTYSRQFNPAVIIDVATLTGAVVAALGETTTGLMTHDKTLQDELEKAADISLDRVWPLPLWEDYQVLINSNVADMANLGFRGAGSITAGCFLSRFAEGMRWAHLDVAGTAYVPGRNKTATGRPVPLLVQYLLDYCDRLSI